MMLISKLLRFALKLDLRVCIKRYDLSINCHCWINLTNIILGKQLTKSQLKCIITTKYAKYSQQKPVWTEFNSPNNCHFNCFFKLPFWPCLHFVKLVTQTCLRHDVRRPKRWRHSKKLPDYIIIITLTIKINKQLSSTSQ